MLKLKKNKKGFSLVELIVVIAIMAILAGVVGGTMFGQLNKQKDNSAASELANLVSSLKGDIQSEVAIGSGLDETKCVAIITGFEEDNAGVIVAEVAADKTPKAGSHTFALTGTGGTTTYTFTFAYYTTKNVKTIKTLTVTYETGAITVA